jgi:hypothetical protein
MKTIKHFFPFGLVLGIALLTFSCLDEHHFGKSSLKQILYFTVPGQVGNTQIQNDSLQIRITVGAKVDVSRLFADSISLSSYASIAPGKGDLVDFRQPVFYQVTAEDGSSVNYRVLIQKETETPQLENSGFDDWHTPSGKNYLEPGKDENTIWASGNAGVVTLGAANVEKTEISAGDFGAKLTTRDLGPLAQLLKQGMAAGSMFTGDFVLDIANPLNSAKFGTPFTARPKSFTISYTYSPGAVYKNGSGQVLAKKDQADIYLLLENREGNIVRRVATAWFRSGDTVNEPKEITIPLTYGTLPSGSPAHWFPANGLFADANAEVTHLSFVVASSAEGANFEGGVNSTLIVNNLRLNY